MADDPHRNTDDCGWDSGDVTKRAEGSLPNELRFCHFIRMAVAVWCKLCNGGYPIS
jgi:hypothetical protein